MQAVLKRYWSDVFWRNNAIFLAGSLFVAFLNYLYYPALGRLMSVSNFGEVQALLSIFNLVGMLFAAFQIVAINISANNKKTGAEIIRQFEHLALLLVMGLLVLITVFSGKLQLFFKFGSYVPFIVLGLTFVIGIMAGFRQAYIQGKNNFIAVSLSGVIGALSKLVFSVLLIVAGLKTLGAVTGILIAQTLALLYVVRSARQMGFASDARSIFTLPKFRLLKPELRYLFSVMTVFFVVTLLHSGDVLVVKRYFDPQVAGQYAGISAIAKIIFFATASFAGVLLASVGQSYSKEHNRAISRKSLFLVLAVGGAALLVFTLLPELIITLLIGSRYAAYAHLLPLLSLVIFLVAIVNLYFYYFLALRQQHAVVPIAIVGGLTTLALTVIRHGTLEAVIQNFLSGSMLALLLLVGLGVFYKSRVHEK